MSRQQTQKEGSNSTISAEDMRRLRHDMRGPLINIEGFVRELEDASTALVELIQSHEPDLPTAFIDRATDILKGDFSPCIAFVDGSVAELNQRIDQFVEEYEGPLLAIVSDHDEGQTIC